MTAKELFKKDFARIRRKIEKYNGELARYVAMTESNEVPDIECTVIGTSPMEPIEVTEVTKGIIWSEDGVLNEIVVCHECGEYWIYGEDELDEQLHYNRRRLRKGIRVWRSENPDAELEKDED